MTHCVLQTERIKGNRMTTTYTNRKERENRNDKIDRYATDIL